MFDVIQAAINQVKTNNFKPNTIYFINSDYLKWYKTKKMINRLKKDY